MSEQQARDNLIDALSLWSGGVEASTVVVEAACQALVAGLDSPGLRALAGLPFDVSTYELEDVAPAVVIELGLPYSPPRTEGAAVAAARVMAARCLRGELTPRDLA